jgi:uncharacterized membrane protein
MNIKLGDFVKAILSPFVKGTSLESCSGCEERRKKLNKLSTGIASFISQWIARITCPCFWRNIFSKNK